MTDPKATFTCVIEIAALRRALDAATSVLPNRSTMPILAHVLLEAADGGRLRMVGTDLGRTVEIEVLAVDVGGATTLPGKALKDIVKRFADGCQVEIVAYPDHATIRGGRGRAKLPVLPAEDYMPRNRPEGDVTRLVMQGKALAGLLDGVGYAASTDDKAAFSMCGVRLEVRRDDPDEPMLRAVAVDGYRLHWRDAALLDCEPAAEPVTLPNAAVQAMAKVAAEAEEVELVHDAHRLALFVPGLVVSSRLIDARFMDYGRAAPKPDTAKVRVTVDPKRLVNAVEGALAVATDKGNGVRVIVAEDAVTVDRMEGETEIEISAEAEGESLADATPLPHAFGVNGRYLVQTIGAVDADLIEISILSGNQIHVCARGKADDPAAYALIMPQALRNGAVATTPVRAAA